MKKIIITLLKIVLFLPVTGNCDDTDHCQYYIKHHKCLGELCLPLCSGTWSYVSR